MPYTFHVPTLEVMREPRNGGRQMINMIERDDFDSALLTGVAGSGKTTVSLQRYLRLKRQNRSVLFITFQRLLAQAANNAVDNNDITTFHRWQYDWTGQLFCSDTFAQNINVALQDNPYSETQLIIDEGQDLETVVYRVLPRYFRRCFVGADNGQQIHTNGASATQIASIFRTRTDYPVFIERELGQNFRNTYEIYRFARQFLPRTNLNAWNENILERLQRDNRRGERPEVRLYPDDNARNADIRRMVGNALQRGDSVAVLAQSPNQVDALYATINGVHMATKIHNDIRPLPPLEGCIITTFKSAKGLEFDQVIIVHIDVDSLNDGTNRQQCYVACTRAKSRLTVCMLNNQNLPGNISADTYTFAGAATDNADAPF